MRVISVKESIFSNNDRTADSIRASLAKRGTFLLNVMSSPGSGKTTLLTALLKNLKNRLKVVAMDVDIETDVDARRIADGAGIESVQIHNGGLCHIDADMVREALLQAKFDDCDLIVLENIGNLVCPAEFDTGAHLKVVLLALPEGDDKPLKYPLMFEKCDLIVVTKIDTLEAFDFDKTEFEKHISRLNPQAQIYYVSAKTGEGLEMFENKIHNIIKFFKGENNNG